MRFGILYQRFPRAVFLDLPIRQNRDIVHPIYRTQMMRDNNRRAPYQ